MDAIRVLHVLQTLKGGGAERQVFDLLPLLSSPEIAVGALTVYSSQLADAERMQLGCPLIDIARRGRGDYSFAPRLVRNIKRFAPHIVHTHTHVGKYWGRIAALTAGVPIVVHTEHNPCDPRRNPLERAVGRILHAGTSRVVTFLEEQREMLSRLDGLSPEKIAIIPNGLVPHRAPTSEDRRIARRTLGLDDGTYAVFVIGRLEYQKNQGLALGAVAALPDQVRARVRLFLFGIGSQEAALRSLARAYALEERVVFLGYRNDVTALLPGGDMLLVTSHFEGMPMTFIEAMFAAVPILSTPWVGAGSMLAGGACGYLADTWDAQPLAQILASALIDERGRGAIAERARVRAAKAYDIRQTAAAHRALYLDLVGVRALAMEAVS